MNWINALSVLQQESQSYVLLTVLEIRGSSPRDSGTKMVVSKDTVFDTIGGGALEYQSIELARELLQSKKHLQFTKQFNLGRDLKQCCGGVVEVFFEVFPAVKFAINIFGAGHIGQALLKILEDLDCRVKLFDTRPELLTNNTAEHIKMIHMNQPEIAVESCSPDSYYLVMTHDHALDQQLCEAILSRADSRYCGLIGSRTKGLKFRQRLLKKGFTQKELEHLTCPMGLPELKTKIPMEIALSVLAELLIIQSKHEQISATRDDILNSHIINLRS